MEEILRINDKLYRPVDEEEAKKLAEYIREFRIEGTTWSRELFIKNDTSSITGELMGMYEEGDESAPFFSEAYLYNLLGKDDARSVLGIIRRLSTMAGVQLRGAV